MGTFIQSNKRVVLRNVNSSKTLQIGVATTLSFYIAERINNTALSSIEYQVEKQSGRTSTVLTSWTDVSLVGVTDDIYTFDYTITGVTGSDNIVLRFKVIDTDDIEAFIELNDFELVV